MSHQPNTYRADIDGLRAIAVLAVILFHINKALLPGGFVGVDVFFVISGYLITRNIVQQIGNGKFSVAEFYRARIKRIAPAMLAVTGISLIAATWLMLPDDATTMAKSAVWSLASFANVYFWLFQDSSYFAASSQHQPLLHLWSLGVEEQFYFIWPIVLMLFYRPGREKLLFIGALAIAGLSFAFGDLFFTRDPSFVYYMLPSRIGELLMGALVALAVNRGVQHKIPASAVAPLATCGVLLLAASLVFLSEDGVFPGVRAIPPTLGAALIILAGACGTTWVSRVLSLKLLLWFGLVSYSAYLWHWPLLAFYRYGYGEVGWVAGVVLFALTWLLAWLTFRFVEQPARHTTKPLLHVFTRQYVLPAGALFAIALGSIYGDRLWPARLQSEYRQQLAGLRQQFRAAHTYDYVCQRQKITASETSDARCVLGPDAASAPKTLLWGDSHAAHYIGMLSTFAEREGFRFRNVQVGACPPLLSDPAPFADARRLADCRQSIRAIQPLLAEAQVVIVGGAWNYYEDKAPGFLDAFLGTARQLASSGKLVILMGKVPEMSTFDRLCAQKALSYPFLSCPDVKLRLTANVASANEKLRQFAQATPNVRYFDANRYLCPDGNCSAYDKSGGQLYYDQTHLAMSGSWKLGKSIVAADGVPQVFQSVAGWPGASPAERAASR